MNVLNQKGVRPPASVAPSLTCGLGPDESAPVLMVMAKWSEQMASSQVQSADALPTTPFSHATQKWQFAGGKPWHPHDFPTGLPPELPRRENLPLPFSSVPETLIEQLLYARNKNMDSRKTPKKGPLTSWPDCSTLQRASSKGARRRICPSPGNPRSTDLRYPQPTAIKSS